MHFSIPFVRPQIAVEPPALVFVMSSKDVTWHLPDRPVFKAPPLNVLPPLADIAAFTAERRGELLAS